MKKELQIKTTDWSINLEDPFYEENPNELLNASIEAVRSTGVGSFVNLVTPSSLSDPENWMTELGKILRDANIHAENIRYVDQCGCGGHVIRVHR